MPSLYPWILSLRVWMANHRGEEASAGGALALTELDDAEDALGRVRVGRGAGVWGDRTNSLTHTTSPPLGALRAPEALRAWEYLDEPVRSYGKLAWWLRITAQGCALPANVREHGASTRGVCTVLCQSP